MSKGRRRPTAQQRTAQQRTGQRPSGQGPGDRRPTGRRQGPAERPRRRRWLLPAALGAVALAAVVAVAVVLPEGIGIPNPQTQPSTEGPFVVSGSCFYWLHSHAADGVIHVEAPVQRTFTLGDWFDLWGQPLTSAQVAADSGTVIAYVNGRRHDGDPRSIPLESHAVIQLDVGTDVAPQPYAFPAGL